jgi:hypothetical protein
MRDCPFGQKVRRVRASIRIVDHHAVGAFRLCFVGGASSRDRMRHALRVDLTPQNDPTHTSRSSQIRSARSTASSRAERGPSASSEFARVTREVGAPSEDRLPRHTSSFPSPHTKIVRACEGLE